MRFLPAAEDAILVELEDLEQTIAFHESLVADPVPGIVELVPAARTVLIAYRPRGVSVEQLVARLRSRALASSPGGVGALVEIPVHYAGEDLSEVAELLGLTPAEVVARHTAGEYRVAFTGFAPGFAYLSGGDPTLDVPRRASPRSRIPAGAVGLAGTFSGVYPRESPGGWQLIGVTDLPMWDLAREVPALLQPGDRVRFVEAGAVTGPPSRATDAAARPTPTTPCLEVLQPGIQSLLQDLGRPGLARLGVSASGALDRRSLRDANRLVGNPVDAACVEVAHGGLVVASRGETVVAVAGAVGDLVVRSPTGERAVRGGVPFALADGDELHLGIPERGMRSYLAVRGGFDGDAVLGSLSTDTLSGLGPAVLSSGTRLAVRRPERGLAAVALEPAAVTTPLVAQGETVVLDLLLGPRADWFTQDAIAVLESQEWRISPRSNRVGLRLEGAVPLERSVPGELPSEGTVTGALQVPADGQPVLFLADHPLTGGYPVIGAVADHHLDLAGQLPAGASIRFRARGAFRELGDARSEKKNEVPQ